MPQLNRTVEIVFMKSFFFNEAPGIYIWGNLEKVEHEYFPWNALVLFEYVYPALVTVLHQNMSCSDSVLTMEGSSTLRSVQPAGIVIEEEEFSIPLHYK